MYIIKEHLACENLVWSCEDMSEETEHIPHEFAIIRGKAMGHTLWTIFHLLEENKWLVFMDDGVDSFVRGESGKLPWGWVRTSKAKRQLGEGIPQAKDQRLESKKVLMNQWR